jgi:protein-S-isoprenylcysteine O-methyltransferase Ste14
VRSPIALFKLSKASHDIFPSNGTDGGPSNCEIVVTKFGAIDKSDLLIPPFPLFYFYVIFVSALHWPSVVHSTLFSSAAVALGVALCSAALGLMAATLVAFGSSFRIFIDTEHPDKLITAGVFAYSRNPIYVAFALVLAGEFLILPHWLLLLYLIAGVALFTGRSYERKPMSRHITGLNIRLTANACAGISKWGQPG